jgi:hypothetical protein
VGQLMGHLAVPKAAEALRRVIDAADEKRSIALNSHSRSSRRISPAGVTGSATASDPGRQAIVLGISSCRP